MLIYDDPFGESHEPHAVARVAEVALRQQEYGLCYYCRAPLAGDGLITGECPGCDDARSNGKCYDEEA